jgi:hypothetical protein
LTGHRSFIPERSPKRESLPSGRSPARRGAFRNVWLSGRHVSPNTIV